LFAPLAEAALDKIVEESGADWRKKIRGTSLEDD
jgi:hypothetical protein